MTYLNITYKNVKAIITNPWTVAAFIIGLKYNIKVCIVSPQPFGGIRYGGIDLLTKSMLHKFIDVYK